MRVFVIIGVLVFAVSAVSPSAVAEEPAGVLAVQVVGVNDTGGKVCVRIYNKSDDFPDEGKQFSQLCGQASEGKAFVVFKSLPQGEYGAFAFHDEDGNGQLKTNFIGMPKEGVGCSRGAKGFMGPPKFKDAAFKVSSEKKVIRIKLKYI